MRLEEEWIHEVIILECSFLRAQTKENTIQPRPVNFSRVFWCKKSVGAINLNQQTPRPHIKHLSRNLLEVITEDTAPKLVKAKKNFILI